MANRLSEALSCPSCGKSAEVRREWTHCALRSELICMDCCRECSEYRKNQYGGPFCGYLIKKRRQDDAHRIDQRTQLLAEWEERYRDAIANRDPSAAAFALSRKAEMIVLMPGRRNGKVKYYHEVIGRKENDENQSERNNNRG